MNETTFDWIVEPPAASETDKLQAEISKLKMSLQIAAHLVGGLRDAGYQARVDALPDLLNAVIIADSAASRETALEALRQLAGY